METAGDKEIVISIQGLVQKIGHNTVLNGVDLELYRGECLGIFGLRGAGKTTLLHAAAGVDRIKSGTIEVLGQRVGKSQAYKAKMGLVTQAPSLFSDLDVAENLDLFSVIKRVAPERIQEAVIRMELEKYLKNNLSSLKIGVYQRLALGCALLNHPEILIVDELIRDIDMESHRIILRVLEDYLQQGNSCLWSFSNIEYVHYMDRVAWLDEGQVRLYTPDEAKKIWQEMYSVIPKKRGEHDV